MRSKGAMAGRVSNVLVVSEIVTIVKRIRRDKAGILEGDGEEMDGEWGRRVRENGDLYHGGMKMGEERVDA